MTDDQPLETVPDGGTETSTVATTGGGDGPHGSFQWVERGVTEPAAQGNQEFLLELTRREPVLQALRSGSATGSELATSVDMSRSTVHRATTALEEYDLVAKSNGEYELTGLGHIIAKRVDAFGAEVRTARSLEPFLNTIDMPGFPTEYFIEASITRPTPRQPHTSIHRIIELIEQSDSLRMLSTVLSPIYVDVGYREMQTGMEVEAVFDEEAIDIMASLYAEKAKETIEMGNFAVYSHPGLPFELFILDDKMGMAAHDEHGVARVLVECEDAAAIEWAKDLYAEHRSEAVPLMMEHL
jgi:predicted transcriptional regulator